MIGGIKMSSVIDNIIDQSDRYDKKNIEFEQDVIWRIRREHDSMNRDILSRAVSVDNMLTMQTMMNGISNAYTIHTNKIKSFLSIKLQEYADKAYENVGNLIDIGKETSGNMSEGLQEQRKLVYSNDIVDILKQNMFAKITGKTLKQIDDMRSKILELMLAGEATKQNVRNAIQNVLNCDKSYAELVAQTELSAAYNMGTIKRLKEYEKISGHTMKKYWHGFKYSERTCEYCRERIGGVYSLDDESETLPAHPNCRCVWLPFDEEWDKSARDLVTKANMLNTMYSPEMIYTRINNRLGIRYGKYIKTQPAADYLAGDRSTKVIDALRDARENYISDLIDSFDIQSDTSNTAMSQEFNEQIEFWKRFVATKIADGDDTVLRSCKDAISGVMLLPWSPEQMEKWNKLLSNIVDNVS